jgi:16S rRNA (cytosine1402-N4)-methyltransferase
MDLDPGNLQFASARAATHVKQVESIHGTFADASRLLSVRGVQADVVLADLGFASNQMDDPARGFSFLRDGPLDMRLNPGTGDSAATLLARLSERDLADAIFQLGEDPFSRRIARQIVQRRQREPFVTTRQLAETVREAYGSRARDSRMHPATRTFMALRILVNDELAALQYLLEGIQHAARAAHAGAPTWLRPGARVAIISFHSLEDRAVKQAFATLESSGMAERLTKKPTLASESEIAANPRARSAKLRAVRFV